MQYRILPLLLMMASLAVPASAQTLSLTIQDGLVNLDAAGASIRQILDAWSRIGGTKIVNGERLTGGPVTLKLVNQPERQALETILRSAAGYMAIPRAASATPGSSMFDRIMVLPTSTAPQGNAPRAAAASTPPNPFLRGRRTDDGDEPAQAEPEPDPAQPPVFTFPQQGQAAEPMQGNPFMQNGANPQGSPFGAPSPPQQAQPFGSPQFGTTNPFMPQQPQQQTNPFMPQQQQPQQQQPIQTPFGQVQTPIVNPFAAAAGAAQQQQQQQIFPNAAPAPAPGTFTIIGSPTPGTVAQPQPTVPGQRPPGQQQ